jgi:hypothetical protein
MWQNIRLPINAENFLSRCITGGLSSSAQLHGVSFVTIFVLFLSIVTFLEGDIS